MRKNPEYIVLGLVIFGLIIGLTVAYKLIPPAPGSEGTERSLLRMKTSEAPSQQNSEMQAKLSREQKELCNRVKEIRKLMLDGKGTIEKGINGWRSCACICLRNISPAIGEQLRAFDSELTAKIMAWCEEPAM